MEGGRERERGNPFCVPPLQTRALQENHQRRLFAQAQACWYSIHRRLHFTAVEMLIIHAIEELLPVAHHLASVGIADCSAIICPWSSSRCSPSSRSAFKSEY